MTFDELFLSREEQKKYELEKLYKMFVLEPKEMLERLRILAQDSELCARRATDSYLQYESHFFKDSDD